MKIVPTSKRAACWARGWSRALLTHIYGHWWVLKGCCGWRSTSHTDPVSPAPLLQTQPCYCSLSTNYAMAWWMRRYFSEWRRRRRQDCHTASFQRPVCFNMEDWEASPGPVTNANSSARLEGRWRWYRKHDHSKVCMKDMLWWRGVLHGPVMCPNMS